MSAEGVEGEFEPGSDRRVLRNKLGISRKREMDQTEFDALTAAQEKWLKTVTSETRFTAELIRQMHSDWLEGVYVWAGKYRTVELQKGNFRWPPAYLVDQNMSRFEAGLLAENTPCRPGPVHEKAMSIARVHADLLLIHPFREGNGRLSRWLAGLMASQAGLPLLDYGFVGKGGVMRRKLYPEAVVQGYRTNYAPLADLFADLIERPSGAVSTPPSRRPRAPSKMDD